MIMLSSKIEDDEVIRDTLKDAGVKASDINLDVVNPKELKNDPNSMCWTIRHCA